MTLEETPLVGTLVELVNIRSETGNEGRLCTHLAERLMPVWGHEGSQRIGNSLVVGHRTGRPLISLYGHIDTVPYQGQADARIGNDRLHGLGSSDMKAGVAVMVHLLEDVDVRDGPFDVVGVFYEREEGPVDENGLEDVLDRAGWLENSELGIVLEPTDLAIELGCQGVINARVVFAGEAAHSARPWLGENAITKAGEWLARLGALEPEPIDVEGLEFREVATVTSATGGVARNVVPAKFELNLNYRFAPDKTPDDALARLEQLVAGADDFEVVDLAPPGPVQQANPHVVRLSAVSGTVYRAKQAWTDVARLAARGIPAVNYGPGEAEQAHTVAESVKLKNLTVIYDALWRFLSTEGS